MAVSDYDHLVIGPDGTSKETEIKSGSWGLEPYKNWLYIKNTETSSSMFMQGTIGQIYGDSQMYLGPFVITTKEFQICKEGPTGIFFLVKDYDYHKEIYNHWAGVACSGYESVFKSSLLKRWIKKAGLDVQDASDYCTSVCSFDMVDGHLINPFGLSTDDKKDFHGFILKDTSGEDVYIHIGKREMYKWRGVDKEIFDAFWAWLKTQADEYDTELLSWIDSVKVNSLQRVNQGDQFFADALGIENGATLIGGADEPVLMKAIKGMNDE